MFIDIIETKAYLDMKLKTVNYILLIIWLNQWKITFVDKVIN